MAKKQRDRIGIIYENDDWVEARFKEMERRKIPYDRLRVNDAAFDLSVPTKYAMFINCVSPSSYLRGHFQAIGYAQAFMDAVESGGTRVINGRYSFHLETSKIAQNLLMNRLNVRTPKTLVFNNRKHILDEAKKFNYPAMLKPNMGGSGAFVRKVESFKELEAVLKEEEEIFAPDQLLLLQEFVVAKDSAVIRTELIDGELVLAMKVFPKNTFNLCPAESCDRFAANKKSDEEPSVEFKCYGSIPSDAVAQSREIVREARLDVGGVEYIDGEDGHRYFLDINATSVFRADICKQSGVNGVEKFGDFIEREYNKELVKIHNQ